ncbi:MAG: IS481 family transposase [Acidobacteriota bacterium]|nr:IS481 family transposase [Acidobacteriota bacterium]
MKERMRFVVALESGLYSMSEACERFGISRVTGYKWWNRFCGGDKGLEDWSRRPQSSPGRTPQGIEALVIELRKAHTTWGPEKLLEVLSRRHPGVQLPARSTTAAILKREGLIEKRRVRRNHRHPGQPYVEAYEPNDLWTADYKGEFKTLDGRYCYPLTIADQESRYLIASEGLLSTRGRWARPVFEKVFRKNGLPKAILTDNGPPFAVWNAICGLSALGVWWIQLGIQHYRIEPGKPQQNGRHERMHRTMKAEATRPPGAHLRSQRKKLDAFRNEFNEVRPHQALGNKTPAEVWRPSARPYPRKTPKPEYAEHHEKRRVTSVGHIRFKNQMLFLSSNLLGETVALEEIDDRIWSIYYYDVLIARLDERTGEVIS